MKHIEAIEFFKEEIKQINLLLGGQLSSGYRAYLENKQAYYQYAIDAIEKQFNVINIQKRIDAIISGAEFGERDIYSVDGFFPFNLILMGNSYGDIIVADMSTTPSRIFQTNVLQVDIAGIDF